LSRRVAKASGFLADDGELMSAVACALVSEPIDELVLKFLHLDKEGRLLLDIASKRHNPIDLALAKLAGMLTSPVPDLLVTHYFSAVLSARSSHYEALCSMTVELAGEVHYRLCLYYDRWPFKLLRLVSPDCTEDERRAAEEQFFNTPSCCLDPFFSTPLKKWAGTVEGLRSPTVLAVLRAWANCGKVSIAHVERMHAKNKAAFASAGGKRVSVEAGVYQAHLSQLMSNHVEQGNTDFSQIKHDATYAQALGLRLQSGSRQQQKMKPARPRNRFGSERIRYCNHMSALARQLRGDGPWTRSQEKDARRQWSADFDGMTEQQLRQFRQLTCTPPLPALEDDDPADAAVAEGAAGLLRLMTSRGRSLVQAGIRP